MASSDHDEATVIRKLQSYIAGEAKIVNENIARHKKNVEKIDELNKLMGIVRGDDAPRVLDPEIEDPDDALDVIFNRSIEKTSSEKTSKEKSLDAELKNLKEMLGDAFTSVKEIEDIMNNADYPFYDMSTEEKKLRLPELRTLDVNEESDKTLVLNKVKELIAKKRASTSSSSSQDSQKTGKVSDDGEVQVINKAQSQKSIPSSSEVKRLRMKFDEAKTVQAELLRSIEKSKEALSRRPDLKGSRRSARLDTSSSFPRRSPRGQQSSSSQDQEEESLKIRLQIEVSEELNQKLNMYIQKAKERLRQIDEK